MILITGATGTIGGEVVRQLAARGEKVRALTRDPARARVPEGVEVACADYLAPETVEAAMAGVSALFAVSVFGPGDAEADAALVGMARAAGVRRIVKLSAIGTGDPASGPGGNWHLPGEQAVRASGLEWTVLRPSFFASNTLSWADAIHAGGPVPNMTGTGVQGVVDPRDVSEVAVRALLEPRHAGRTYTLTGPEAIGTGDQAAVLASVLGRPVRTVDLSPDGTREFLTAAGLGDVYVEGVGAGTAYVREGGGAQVAEDVPEVLGRRARTYRTWAEDHRAVFARDSRRTSR
ncbi:SDR family oxidoreductase [Streptomyces capitiformicae]|uniref:Nucleotide-diphosphate-sugar epimerase n=1 Tax=Streptomyces capitiformicae TaxID=2014920 RepID=A0A919DMQ0_9ACTN|nr:SDR family oxidoreductase [Streptomyces capitiformicae]GHE63988.1 nucleotide-diphosphate-sugar epimerase [Streptomyces capitiformicae]